MFASIWQLLDANLLFAVSSLDGVDVPAVIPTRLGPCVPSWVDHQRALAQLPAGSVLQQAPMSSLIKATTLSPETGIVVEPSSPHEILVPAAQRLALIPLAVPFPPGARTAWGEPPAQADPLAQELTSRAAMLPELSRLWLARFQVEDAREQVALVYETTGRDAEQDHRVVQVLHAGVIATGSSFPVRTIAVTDLPGGTQEWLQASIPPLWPPPSPAAAAP